MKYGNGNKLEHCLLVMDMKLSEALDEATVLKMVCSI